ncbi:unnamed protein product [Calypogeia fissa]
MMNMETRDMMNMVSGRGGDADQYSTSMNVWAADRPPEQQKLSLQQGEDRRSERTSNESSVRPSPHRWSSSMDRPERLSSTFDQVSTETTRMETDNCLGSGILNFYPSSSMAAVKISEFQDGSVGRHSELQMEQPYGLDPVAIFKNVTEDDLKMLAPEQNITLFALRLALIEKMASGIGTLSFIWASTILLGGFASNLNPVDFIVITLILVTEGTRIFSRSRELEWQHLASKSTKSSLSAYKTEKSLNTFSDNCDGSEDLPKLSSATPRVVTEDLEPNYVPPSESTVRLNLERAPKAFYKNTVTFATSQEDLEIGLSNISENSRLPLPPGGEKKSTRIDENAEIVDIMDFKPSMNVAINSSRPSRCLPFRWSKSLSANIKDGPSDIEKFEKTVEKFKKFGAVENAQTFKRTWSCRLVPLLSGRCSSIISTRGVSAVLYWIQITSAVICLALSIWRLSEQEYNPPGVLRQDTPVNLYTSLNIFYTLALTEALLFLLERVYWEYKMNYEKLVMQVCKKADLGAANQEMMQQFFYEVYKKCIDGSVFDGLTVDIVEYSLTLLQSDNSFEQLSGIRVLRKIVDRYEGFSFDALRRTGAAPGVIERLVEMLSWRGAHDQDEIRLEVAALICRLVRYSKNCFRVAAVPGAMEGIVSLLRPHERDQHVNPSSIDIDTDDDLRSTDRAIALRLNGLRILVALARDSVNLLKIGETRGLVAILVAFIAVKDVHAFRKLEGSELKTFKKVLRLLKMLSAARNGTLLRPVIVRVVFGIASMRDILEFGDCHPQLQLMAIEILINLTLDDVIRRSIGSTGGVIKNLFNLYSRNLDWSKNLFLSEKDKTAEKAVSKRAGNALDLLAAMCMKNCLRMMALQDGNEKKTFIPALLKMLNEHREQTICAAKILRSLLEYGNYSQKREIAVCIGRVMRLIMGSPRQRMHEAAVGLASRVLGVLDEPTYNLVFEHVDRTELVRKLLRNLEYNPQGSSRLPRIRRHSIEFILVLVNRDPTFFAEFMRDGLLERKLMQALDTICEAEDFVIFSGAEGLTRQSITMEDLVQQSIHDVRILDQEREKHPYETMELRNSKPEF